MRARAAQRKMALSKLQEVQRLVTVIQTLDAQDPEHELAVVRWMVESEEAKELASKACTLLTEQERAEFVAACSAIETERWQKTRIEIEIMRLWVDPKR